MPPPLTERIAALETELAALYEQRDARLLLALASVFDDHEFVSAEVWALRRAWPELQDALTDAGLQSPWQLGKRLRKVEGRAVYGVRLDALIDRHTNCGQIWKVTVLPDSHQQP